MTSLGHYYKKTYYWSLDILLIREKLDLPYPYHKKKNVFIYFDYEREFSGYNTKINNGNIKEILSLLLERKIITTWFTVGKVISKYPQSILDILHHGHEIGSHTYAHIPPFYTANKNLKKDFEEFRQTSQNFALGKGFHSPNGNWSLRLLKYLNTYKYLYDIISCSKSKNCKPHYVITGLQCKILRLYTYGDDWPLFKGNCSAKEALDYYIELVKRIEPGNVGGIGFHPWVLFSNNDILKGFNDFLDYLRNQENVELNPAQFYAGLLRTMVKNPIKSP